MAPAELRSFLRKLRAAFPTKLPVKVRQRRLIDHEGCHYHAITHRCRDHFLIQLHSAAPMAMAKASLCHEWAHVHAWDEPQLHGPKWARRCAKIERWHGAEGEYDPGVGA